MYLLAYIKTASLLLMQEDHKGDGVPFVIFA